MKIIKSVNVAFDPEEREVIEKVAELFEMVCDCGDGSGECQGCPLESHCRQRCGTPLYEVLYDILAQEECGDLGYERNLV